MEKKRTWVSLDELWKVKLRIDDVNPVTGEPTWFNDITVSKRNKYGRYELVHAKKYNKEVTAIFEDFNKLKRCEHKKFIAAHYDPYQALSFNDAIDVHTTVGSTGRVYFQSQTDDTITILHFADDQQETINKLDIVELVLHCSLPVLNESLTYQLI